MRTLDQMLQPGQRVNVFYGVANPDNRLCYIRAIVDDDYIVYKVWRNRRKCWSYHVSHREGFELKYESGVLR